MEDELKPEYFLIAAVVLIAFARATEWKRDSVSIQQLSALLGLTESDLDALFEFAAKVTV